MAYRERGAEGGLARWVECVWSLESAETVKDWPVRPDGCLDILYSPAGLEVVGAMTVEKRYDLAAGARTVGLRFKPGMAAQFLGVAAEELTDRIVKLADVWGSAARGLQERMGEASSVEECCRLLAEAVPGERAREDGVRRAIGKIVAAGGDIDLDWVARQAGMSERQFRRRCLEESGMAPKQLCRVLRFRKAMALGGQGLPWGLVAAEAGYFDQAHLIRDFREFTGGTPMSVFSNTSDGGRL